MSLLPRLRSWMRSALHRDDLEERMRTEFNTHLALYEADLRGRGVAADDARTRARAEFGGAEVRKEECREALGLRILDELRGDVRYAFRLLRRSPAFTIVALSSLGLAIGANTAIFTLVDAVLMKTLPVVQDPKTLFFIDNSGGKSGGGNGPPYPCFELLRDRNRFFAGMAAFSGGRLKVTIDGPAELIRGQYASGDYFSVLGIVPEIGRVLMSSDDIESDSGTAAGVISHSLWTRRFNSDPAVVGRRIQVGTSSVTIVGVTPPEFFGLQLGSPVDLTVPMRLSGNRLTAKQNWWFSVIGRIRPGAPEDQARADLENLWDAYMTDIGMPRDRRDYFSGIALVPADKGLDALRRQFSDPLRIMMAIVVLVLMIGCANVANLLLARASARGGEMAVRLAIGASRARLIRQLLIEGLVLVTLGGLAGLLFARWGLSVLLGMIYADSFDGVPLKAPFDLRVLSFTAAIALLTALLFSFAPALRATGAEAAPVSDRTTTRSRARVRVAQSLVAIQVIVAVILQSGAALFVRTLHNLNAVESGFRRDGVLTLQVEATVPTLLTTSGTTAENRARHARLSAIWRDFIDRVLVLPGATAAALGTMSPLAGRDRGVVISIHGRPQLGKENRGIHVNQVTEGYFAAFGMRVISGRGFTASDRAGSTPVAIINETAARTYFGSESPLGAKISFPGQRIEDECEIVGVVADAKYKDLRTPDGRMAYIPLEQSIDPITGVMVAAAGPGDVRRLIAPIREIVTQTVPSGFVTRIGTIDDRVRASLVRERLLAMLAAFFGGLALVLASIGLYGVLSYSVVRRTREIGIRLAVGASRSSVIWIVVRNLLGVVVAGTVAGAFATITAGRYIQSQLFGIEPADPVALSAAALLLLGVAVVAAYLPARRASRIDPAIALRYE